MVRSRSHIAERRTLVLDVRSCQVTSQIRGRCTCLGQWTPTSRLRQDRGIASCARYIPRACTLYIPGPK